MTMNRAGRQAWSAAAGGSVIGGVRTVSGRGPIVLRRVRPGSTLPAEASLVSPHERSLLT